MNVKATPAARYDVQWPQLQKGILLKRYKRFLADVKLADGAVVTAHCANSGSMKACSTAGRPVYISFEDNPKRKLKYTWHLIEEKESLVGVHTGVPNRLVKQAILDKKIEAFAAYGQVKSEVSPKKGTRLDLFLTQQNLPDAYIEIKNCTLVENGVARFPDAVTQRGQKHLQELMDLAKQGISATIFFLIQRMDAKTFIPADDIDPEYGRLLRKAASQGVKIMAWDTDIDLKGISLANPVPISL